MFDECGLGLCPEMATRGRLINLISDLLHILSVALHYPALWPEAKYDLRESRNCPRTFDTYFTYSV